MPKDNIPIQNSITKIQNKTGILDYDEDPNYSHIKINQENCDNTEDKSWVPLCPVNCYTLVNNKGIFILFSNIEFFIFLISLNKIAREDSIPKISLIS